MEEKWGYVNQDNFNLLRFRQNNRLRHQAFSSRLDAYILAIHHHQVLVAVPLRLLSTVGGLMTVASLAFQRKDKGHSVLAGDLIDPFVCKEMKPEVRLMTRTPTKEKMSCQSVALK